MSRHWFHPAVCVETAKPGQSYAVTSVERAAELLLEWADRGPEWRRAAKACQAVIAGTKPAAEARDAFRKAAKAADRLIEVA